MTETEIGAVSAAAASILALLGKLWFDWRKAAARSKTAGTALEHKLQHGDMDYLFDQYRKIVAELRADSASMKTSIELIRAEHVACLKKNAELETKLTFLEESVAALKTKVAELSAMKKP